MKKVLMSLVVLALGATAASAASIVGTKHDLSSGATHSGLRSDTTQICVFCHTPHNAVVNKLLWNRSTQDPAGYGLFSSSNISSQMKTLLAGAKLTTNSSSLLCLSCHDRATANLILSDMGPSRGGATSITDIGGNWSAYSVSGDGTRSLTNDHPIGFSYDAAYQLNSGTTGLRTAAAAKTAMNNGNIFFDNGTVGDAMECASCHMTHDNSNGKFLRATSAASAICLACHIK